MDKLELEALLSRIKAALEQHSWPDVYLFKFIVPSDNDKIAQVCALFDDSAKISLRESHGKKYTSISIRTVMIDIKSILDIYRKATEIEGIISL